MSNPPEKPNRFANRRKSGHRAKAIGAYVPKVARAAFEKHGFPSADLLADWPDIMGADYGSITAPERLVWPRGAEPRPEDQLAPRGFKNARGVGATLVLRVEGPRAVEIQHVAPQILERINVYFGYRAVSDLRLVQGPVRQDRKLEAEPEDHVPDPAPLDADIADEGLRFALARLSGRIK
ncbi:MAG: DciA family protein [Hyphomicrobiaceae bacterium]|nr:DciA family protein [Hyphomicrobiaceae bacterium]